MADNKSSKSTERAARNAKNTKKVHGAVRVHTKKPNTVPLKAGEDLMTQLVKDRRAVAGIKQVASGPRPKTQHKPFIRDAVEARRLVESQMGPKAVELAKTHKWSPESKQLVCNYIRSLTRGDATRPEGLNDAFCKFVEALFGDACYEQRIAWDILPGQKAEFYLRRTAKARDRQVERRRELASVS